MDEKPEWVPSKYSQSIRIPRGEVGSLGEAVGALWLEIFNMLQAKSLERMWNALSERERQEWVEEMREERRKRDAEEGR